MLDSKTFFVVNPESANGKTASIWAHLLNRFPDRPSIDYELTRYSTHASEITTRALEADYETVVAVGGDGTVNEVLNGFYRAGRLINPKARLSYVPCGTGKDLARTLGMSDFTPEQILESIAEYRVLKLDHGMARFRANDEQQRIRYFMNEASVGFSADTVRVVNRSSKALGGKVSFFLGVFRCLAGLKNHAIRIDVDGEQWYSGKAFLVAIANGKFFGGSMQIAPRAQMNDSVFDIVLITTLKRLEVVKHIGKIYSGEHLALPQVSTTRGKTVRITSEEFVPIEMDGEQPGALDAQFSMIEKGINLLAP
jgi:diacylglycerol kinase (ATP)